MLAQMSTDEPARPPSANRGVPGAPAGGTGCAPRYLADDGALEEFVAAWRAGRLPKPEWTHAAHVAVCAYHAWGQVALDDLVSAMRHGIRAYNDAVGTANTPTSGYHETLTRFWAGVVLEHLRTLQPGSRLDAARSAVDTYGAARGLHAAYYSFDVVGDRAARAAWVPPDRRPDS